MLRCIRPGQARRPCSKEQLSGVCSHNAIVRTYIRRKRADAAAEFQSYAALGSITAVVQFAALCQPPGTHKRHSHQRRIPQRALVQARDRLLKANLPACKTFHQLHDVVAQTIGRIRGIGDLTIYDIATRVGAFLSLEPDRVYLHRGTREGAGYLLSVAGRQWVWPRELPSAFLELRPREIEDCLCIFKRQLKEISMRAAQD